MNKKVLSGLAVAATLILLLAGLYYLSGDKSPKTGPIPVTAPGAPATTPAKPEAPAAAPTLPTPKEPPAAPGLEPPGPPKGAAPVPEPQVTVLPPLEPSQHYGMLAGSYEKYADAARMLARLKKPGTPAFVQRDPRNLNRYQVWLGPFSSRDEAREAGKSLQAILKKPLKIEPIENPVPK
jgi:cell division septation protein DedD